MGRTRRAQRFPRTCTAGATAAFLLGSLIVARARADERGAPKFRHFWVGLTFGLAAEWHPSGNDVCAVDAQGQSTSGWICAQSDGPRYPPPGTLPASGQAGRVGAGFGGPGVEVMVASFDYAITDGFLVGLRSGFYFHPTNVNVSNFGTYSSIYEARATWVLGPQPLSRAGIRPYALFGVGLGDFSARAETAITTTDANGPQQVSAWRVAGPGFATTGIGVRIGTPRFALMIAPFKIALPFGAGSAATFMPEITFMSASF